MMKLLANFGLMLQFADRPSLRPFVGGNRRNLGSTVCLSKIWVRNLPTQGDPMRGTLPHPWI